VIGWHCPLEQGELAKRQRCPHAPQLLASAPATLMHMLPHKVVPGGHPHCPPLAVLLHCSPVATAHGMQPAPPAPQVALD
jgi:hypothetical protein